MNQENEIARFLVIPFDIMGLKDLNPTDKLVFARIAGFRKFFEASQTTADFLGLSKIQVERSKRKLVKLGYIIELADTGRGKIYRSDDFFCILDRIESSDKNVKSDMTKMSDQTRQKCQTENKKRIKREYKGAEAQNDQEFGRKDINDMVERWSREISDIKGDKNQRRQIYNLIRKYGEVGAIELIHRIVAMQTTGDQYAPLILKPSDLTGKYSKLAKLEAWEARQAERPKLPSAPSSWFQRPPEYEEISDEERAIVSQRIKEARKTLPFLNKEAKK